ncbi:hypothetical protein H2198_004028 [Neophaeococcomyces mojaviensis]|uniref:Uncharacterized protein n=1 Tax=Neophaeococcomyces mojaviensis TaxID=3383035 RepID=A0ACC3AAK9_9EURO|nr:hypothetical protein H2198_004028 [Knufia sp. JES_112]
MFSPLRVIDLSDNPASPSYFLPASYLLTLPTELLAQLLVTIAENNLLYLLSIQQVCKTFRDLIRNNHTLQLLLYLTPSESQIDCQIQTINPILFSRFELFFDLSRQEPWVWLPPTSDSDCPPSRFHDFLPPWSSRNKICRSWNRPEASWRRMLISRARITKVYLASAFMSSTSEQLTFSCLDLRHTPLTYLTMGLYYDIVLTHCRRSLHEYGGWTIVLNKSYHGAEGWWPRNIEDFLEFAPTTLESRLQDAPGEAV